MNATLSKSVSADNVKGETCSLFCNNKTLTVLGRTSVNINRTLYSLLEFLFKSKIM
jgi:hypothetical protein